MKSITALFTGFVLNLFFEGFSRIIIAFFFTIEYSFWGISALPNKSWILIIYLVSVVSSWFGCMITLTMAGSAPRKHLIAFLVLTLLWSTFEILGSIKVVPSWYLFTFPLTSVAGIFIADYTFKLNQNAIPTS
ncbi:MAG: hypothetical protein WC967_00835 [Balneolaceae bacterium]